MTAVRIGIQAIVATSVRACDTDLFQVQYFLRDILIDMGARFCRRGAQFNASKPLVLTSKALLPPDLVTDKF